ncbi:MAG: phosphatidylglycerol lysyltransferase [Spirochaetaceae bacterium]|nr:phosphatidylglycerol lysyltransferase [Spirochaetaceae bacterium]
MILSASGWRDVFAEDGGEESHSQKISAFHTVVSAAAASVFTDFLQKKSGSARVIVGLDTRPTGPAIAQTLVKTLLAKNAGVIFCGILAAPEIMAYAAACGAENKADGFIYISASHNPIAYNGVKFGLTDGGVLSVADAAQLEKDFRTLSASQSAAGILLESLDTVDAVAFDNTMNNAPRFKAEALAAYMDISRETAAGGQECVLTELASVIKSAPLGIAADFNGSARTLSIDKDFFGKFKLKFTAINAHSGEIVHQIVPEGEGLTPCRDFLNELWRRDNDFVLAYTPDCDGDRGNIVIFDEKAGCARPLEAQEVFALACLSSLCQLVWTESPNLDKKSGLLHKTAIAVNDATSMRIDRIARAFGAEVFRAETGEANVVNLGRRLRAEGWTTPIMGEGAAGGSIVHPQSVRDPLQTIMALLKLLRIRSNPGKKGFFELWRDRRGVETPYSNNFTLSDVIESLPLFTTTSAYSDDARLKIASAGNEELKERYQKIFLREWREKKEVFFNEWGICEWEAAAYNGSEERRGIKNFGEAGRGGLRIYFSNKNHIEFASLWMRGSGTEPVFRVMADVEGMNPHIEKEFLAWHRGMVQEAAAMPDSARNIL